MSEINPIDINGSLYSQADLGKVDKNAEDEAKREFAKNFESIFLNKLFETVEKSMPESGLGTDAASKQVKGLFWMFLANGVADQGGIGLADQIYDSLSKDSKLQNQTLNEKI